VHRSLVHAALLLGLVGLLALALPAAAHASPSLGRPVVGLTVSGNITDSQSGAPVAGATVRDNVGHTAVTNATGGYAISVPYGSDTLVVTAKAYHGISRTLTVQGPLSGEDFVLPPYTYWVKGTIVSDPGSLPIPGAIVNGPFNMKVVASAQGAFHFILENGTYALTATVSGFETTQVTVTVSGVPISTFLMMVANGSGPTPLAMALSGPGAVLGGGVVAGGFVGGVGYVMFRPRTSHRFRGGAPLAGMPSQQTDSEAQLTRPMDRRALRRRR
jgi:hypothetical protein